METRKEKKPVTVTPVPEQPGIVSALAAAAYNATIAKLIGGPKPELNIITFFYERYGCFDDRELDVIGNFNNAMTKFKDKLYIYHQPKESKDSEDRVMAYSKLAPTAKEELQGIYYSLVSLAKEKKTSIKEVDVAIYTLGELGKQIRELVDIHFNKLKEEVKKTPIPKEKKENYYIAQAHQDFLNKENKLEDKAKSSYDAARLSINDFGSRISDTVKELEQQTSDLEHNIRKNGQVEANHKRFKEFEETKGRAQKLLDEFKDTEEVAIRLCNKFEENYNKKMSVVAKELKQVSIEDKVDEWHSDLKSAINRATQFESVHQGRLNRLKEAVDSYKIQLVLARELLTNLQDIFSPERLTNYWPTQCYTFLGRGGRELNVGDRIVRVPHGIAAMVQGIQSLNPQIMTLKEIKKILENFKRIVAARREARSDTSFFGKIQVRQTPTCNLYEKITKLNIENITDQSVQGFDFNDIQALSRSRPSQPVEIQMQNVVSDESMERKYS